MEKLSDEILVRIFSFLSARDLCRCSQVCSSWCRLSDDFHLWKKLFIESFDKFISDSSYYKNLFPTQWKELFITRSNWLSGHCHVQSLHKKAMNQEKTEPTKVVCLKISNCGGSLLASVNQDSKLVHMWSLIHKKSLHVVQCESVIGCVDFGNERSQNLLAIGLYRNKFILWDFHKRRIILSRTNITEVSRDQIESPRDTGFPPAMAVCRVNLVDNKLATVTSQCVVKVWHLDLNQLGPISCTCLHTLATFKPRCSVLDIQLKNGGNDVWSVSISHAAEVLENWNLIGFQTVRFQGHSLIEEDPGVTFEEGNTVHDIIWFDIQVSFSSLFILNFESMLFIDNNCLIIVIFPPVEESVDYDEDCVTAKMQTWTGIQKEQMGSRTSVSCLSISPCTKLVTSGQNDNTITLWDTATQCSRHILFGHTGAVTCTDVDMHKVVSGSNDRTVKVWSLENGDCQLTLPGDHTSGVSCVTFNDQWVISGDSSGEIKVWDFAVNSLSVLQS